MLKLLDVLFQYVSNTLWSLKNNFGINIMNIQYWKTLKKECKQCFYYLIQFF